MSRLRRNGKQLIEQRLNLDIERSMEMTKPEIIKQLKIELSVWESDCKSHHKTKDALKAAIERLEQDTVSRETYESEYIARKQAELELWKIQQNVSDDCVSRQAVLESINDWWGITSTSGEPTLCDYIRELPPVTPTRKKGKWERGYSFPDGEYVKCTVCGEIIKCIYPMHYCPNCGADMKSEE